MKSGNEEILTFFDDRTNIFSPFVYWTFDGITKHLWRIQKNTTIRRETTIWLKIRLASSSTMLTIENASNSKTMTTIDLHKCQWDCCKQHKWEQTSHFFYFRDFSNDTGRLVCWTQIYWNISLCGSGYLYLDHLSHL